MAIETQPGSNTQEQNLIILERGYPFAVSLIVLIALQLYGHTVVQLLLSDSWKLSNLYTSIFDWSAIQTGFVFGIYAFVVGRDKGFVAQVKNTQAMDRFQGYIKIAMNLGFILTATSIPLIVTDPKVEQPYDLKFFIVTFWFCLFVWALLAFMRVAYIFSLIARIKDKTIIKG